MTLNLGEDVSKQLEGLWNIDYNTDRVVAALLTVAWASTKKDSLSDDAIANMYKNFKGRNL